MNKDLSIKQMEFLKELKELLEKYNAEITWTYDECSDTFGLIDNRLVVSMVGQKTINFYGMDIEACGIEDIIKINTNKE